MTRGTSDQGDSPSGAPWSEADLAELEQRHADGLSTQHVVELFAARGERLSEATFRKYVQLGLLPRSVRVGRKGKHRGSQGLYPATVVRQIELVRRLMAQGYTIQEIQQEFLFLGSDIEGLARQLGTVLEAVQRAAERRGAGERADDVISRAVNEARALADELVDRLRAIERRLAMRARMARAAV
jgi:DNA-binding transcriptional MerR regulator